MSRTAPAPALTLSSLLSQALVAFTIEFDNEFERQMPHRTAISVRAGGGREGPWLVSLVMYSNLMRLIDEEGATARELARMARTTRLSLVGMRRWGYIAVEPPAGRTWAKQPGPDFVVRRTAKGRMAQDVWRPLFGVIEDRWRERFGKAEIERLRQSLVPVVGQLDVALPEYLPVLGYGLTAEVFQQEARPPATPDEAAASKLHLSALLSQVLLAFTIEFERESTVSLAICADVLRVLGEDELRVRDIPRLSGVSKEAIAMALSFLAKRRIVAVGPDPARSRAPVVRLTPRGGDIARACRQLLEAVEQRWIARFGKDDIRELREALQRLAGDSIAGSSQLFLGLKPYPDGWRASVPMPVVLPHHPMVLHRGGFPDGS